jgi:hypothetical protein
MRNANLRHSVTRFDTVLDDYDTPGVRSVERYKEVAKVTNDPLAQMVEMKVNEAVLGIHQTQNPITRAKRAGDLTDYLMARIEDLAAIRRRAVAEALEWPGGSMEKVTAELGVSRSAVVKLAPPDLRRQIAEELRERLARGFNPPPLRPGAARLARKGLSAPTSEKDE